MSTAPIPLPQPSIMATFLSNNPEDEIPPIDGDTDSSPTTHYSVPKETEKLLKAGILTNPLIAPTLPPAVSRYASLVTFTGASKPAIPIPWRFAESISALKALESIWINNLLVEKYGVQPRSVVIDTGHASLFFMSVFLCECLLPSVVPPIPPLLLALHVCHRLFTIENDGKEKLEN